MRPCSRVARRSVHDARPLKAVSPALGVRGDGRKEILGLWIEQAKGAKFWLRVMTELKNRGVEDVLIAMIDGLKAFPEAITAVFPQAQVQTCTVDLIRNSLDFVSYKDRGRCRPRRCGAWSRRSGRDGDQKAAEGP